MQAVIARGGSHVVKPKQSVERTSSVAAECGDEYVIVCVRRLSDIFVEVRLAGEPLEPQGQLAHQDFPALSFPDSCGSSISIPISLA